MSNLSTALVSLRNEKHTLQENLQEQIQDTVDGFFDETGVRVTNLYVYFEGPRAVFGEGRENVRPEIATLQVEFDLGV